MRWSAGRTATSASAESRRRGHSRARRRDGCSSREKRRTPRAAARWRRRWRAASVRRAPWCARWPSKGGSAHPLAAGFLLLRTARDGDGAVGPRSQRLRVLEEILGQLVILHRRAALAERLERVQASAFEVRTRGVVHFQVEHIVVDEGEEQLVGVEAHAPEHALRPHGRQYAAQLVEHEGLVARAHRHQRGLGAACRAAPSSVPTVSTRKPRAWRLSTSGPIASRDVRRLAYHGWRMMIEPACTRSSTCRTIPAGVAATSA